MINPVLLKSFCTLAELGHFTRTADKLHMTQSGVSQHVRKLEESLGQTLLIRQGKKFSLTHAGNQAYQKGKQILQAMEELETSLQDDPEFEGEVSIMSPGSVGLRLYPDVLAMQQTHSKLTVDYRFAPNDSIESHLSQGLLDIGLMNKLTANPKIDAKEVAKEALVLVTPADFDDCELTSAAVSSVSWNQLKALGFIQHPDSAYQAALLLGANFPEFSHIDDIRKSGFSNQIGSILEPVSLGLGFTVLPAFAVDAFTYQNKIKRHTFPNPVNETIYLCTNREHVLPKRVMGLLARLEGWLA